ncbi:helix-turn-helix domain-containing protein [Streptomyces sp. TRM43335]|uniref:Helix-turn-helix domain-containing protein n=1 Tax=Streptomyces taklimakanensis TaxID=2569853 RepID=A0A6G2B627_9ACTN|nr:helix-turn-helix domain-containing protein [Streptomyces taklimakanensis]MTE17711.1 helix-turn-helix domain-containing protein [Streptomyces taklimakanensis]
MLEQPHFGRRLRRLRLERGLSQAAVVGEGMSTGYLSRLESGERRPTPRAVAYLAQRLDVDVSALSEPSGHGSLRHALAAASSAPPGTDSTVDLLRALQDDEHAEPADRWHALWLLSRIDDSNGDYEKERGRLRELIELSESLAAPELRARTNVQYARCLRALGDLRTAEPAAMTALAIAREEDLQTADIMAALVVLIGVEAELGRLDAAGRHVHELERDLLPAATAPQAAEALWTASLVSHRQGDHATAQNHLETALNLLEGRDDPALWTRLRTAAAATALEMSPPRLEAAQRWLDEAGPIIELTGTPLRAQELHALRAHLAFHRGELDEARTLCRALLSDDDLRLPYRDRTRLLVLEGRLSILDGRVDEGITALEQLGHQATDARNLDLAAHVWQSLATALAQVRAPAARDAVGSARGRP